MKIINFIIICLISFSISATPLDFKNYIAKYKVYWRGLKVGTSYHKLDNKNDVYIMDTRTEPLLKFLPFSHLERSKFEIVNKQIKPKEYFIDSYEKKEHKEIKLDFDWQQSMVIANGKKLYDLKTTMQDKLSHLYQLKIDLQGSENKFTYQVIKDDEISKYTFQILGNELIDTPLGKLDTVKLRQTSNTSSRNNVIWMAKPLGLLIVKTEQYRKNKLLGRIEIVDFVQSK